jgi:hypothetical protein
MYEPFNKITASRADRVAWILCQIIDEDAPMRWTRYRSAAECIAGNEEVMADLLALRRAVTAPVDLTVQGQAAEARLEQAYWEFDARRKGYGQWGARPMSERDAFKSVARQLVADGVAARAEALSKLRVALSKLIDAGEFMVPNQELLTGTDAIACLKQWLSANNNAAAALVMTGELE